MSNNPLSDSRPLFERMTVQDGEQKPFDDDQVRAMVEILVPRLIQNLPGMAQAGLTCQVFRDDDGWTLKVRKPSD